MEGKDRQRGKQHEVWEDTFDWKQCRTEKFIIQKLRYIHENPCTEHWQLADRPEHYAHSSATFYHNCRQGVYPVRDYREVMVHDEEE